MYAIVSRQSKSWLQSENGLPCFREACGHGAPARERVGEGWNSGPGGPQENGRELFPIVSKLSLLAGLSRCTSKGGQQHCRWNIPRATLRLFSMCNFVVRPSFTPAEIAFGSILVDLFILVFVVGFTNKLNMTKATAFASQRYSVKAL
jgi:hypothetical protein